VQTTLMLLQNSLFFFITEEFILFNLFNKLVIFTLNISIVVYGKFCCCLNINYLFGVNLTMLLCIFMLLRFHFIMGLLMQQSISLICNIHKLIFLLFIIFIHRFFLLIYSIHLFLNLKLNIFIIHLCAIL